MDITLRFIGKLQEAHISLNDITVIAGENNSGKTTIAKTIYGMLYPLVNLEKRILNRKAQSMTVFAREWFRLAVKNEKNQKYEDNILTDYYFYERIIQSKFEDFIINNPSSVITEDFLKQAVKEYLQEMGPVAKNPIISNEETAIAIESINRAYSRNDMDYARLVFEQSFVQVFHGQISTFGKVEESDLQFGNIRFGFDKNRLVKFEFSIPDEYQISSVVYLPACRISHEAGNFLRRRLIVQLNKDSALLDSNLTLEQHELIQKNQEEFSLLIDSIIKGHLEHTERGFVFVENSHPSEQIALDNVASGILPLAYIGRLINNGTIRKDTILIIDEPEMNLHPEWQLHFARLLVSLNQKIGVRIVLSSHSPYFIRAVEKTLAIEGNQKVDGRFYLMKSQKQLFVTTEVTDHMKEIYEQLYRPFEEL
ncbi:MAG: AAA family ATPase [Sphaerochaetaceae bacterium]|nr:AAA family ATPase [Sphaerochaetaceae bacterium]